MYPILSKTIVVASLALLGRWVQAAGQLELPQIFGDGMVLQSSHDAGLRAQIFGYATPHTRVHLTIPPAVVNCPGPAACTLTTVSTDVDGAFRFTLPPSLPAATNAPFSITIATDDGAQRVLHDVVFGDVFVCAGAGEMTFPLRLADNASSLLDMLTADPSTVRLFAVPNEAAATPQRTLADKPCGWSTWSWDGGEGSHHHMSDRCADYRWAPATPQLAADFSALCQLTAHQLQLMETLLHSGIEDGSESSAPQQPVLGLIQLAVGASEIDQWMPPPATEDYPALSPQHACLLPEDYHPPSTPEPIEGVNAPGQAGWELLRSARQLQQGEEPPEALSGPSPAPAALRSEADVWAVHQQSRVSSTADSALRTGGPVCPLSDAPEALWKAMGAPIAGYTTRAVFYAQGERDAELHIPQATYTCRLRELIHRWRSAWSRDSGSLQPELPFLLSQLQPLPQGPAFDAPAIRLAQAEVAADVSQVGLAVQLDTGAPHRIYSPHKAEQAHRLAAAAFDLLYSERLPPHQAAAVRQQLVAPKLLQAVSVSAHQVEQALRAGGEQQQDRQQQKHQDTASAPSHPHLHLQHDAAHHQHRAENESPFEHVLADDKLPVPLDAAIPLVFLEGSGAGGGEQLGGQWGPGASHAKGGGHAAVQAMRRRLSKLFKPSRLLQRLQTAMHLPGAGSGLRGGSSSRVPPGAELPLPREAQRDEAVVLLFDGSCNVAGSCLHMVETGNVNFTLVPGVTSTLGTDRTTGAHNHNHNHNHAEALDDKMIQFGVSEHGPWWPATVQLLTAPQLSWLGVSAAAGCAAAASASAPAASAASTGGAVGVCPVAVLALPLCVTDPAAMSTSPRAPCPINGVTPPSPFVVNHIEGHAVPVSKQQQQQQQQKVHQQVHHSKLSQLKMLHKYAAAPFLPHAASSGGGVGVTSPGPAAPAARAADAEASAAINRSDRAAHRDVHHGQTAHHSKMFSHVRLCGQNSPVAVIADGASGLPAAPALLRITHRDAESLSSPHDHALLNMGTGQAADHARGLAVEVDLRNMTPEARQLWHLTHLGHVHTHAHGAAAAAVLPKHAHAGHKRSRALYGTLAGMRHIGPTLGISFEALPAGAVTESAVLQVAQLLNASGLQDAGYNRIMLHHWSVASDALGRPLASSHRFPHGIPWLVSKLQQQGLRLSLSLDLRHLTSSHTSGKVQEGSTATPDFTAIDITMSVLCSWGVDGVDVTHCGIALSGGGDGGDSGLQRIVRHARECELPSITTHDGSGIGAIKHRHMRVRVLDGGCPFADSLVAEEVRWHPEPQQQQGQPLQHHSYSAHWKTLTELANDVAPLSEAGHGHDLGLLSLAGVESGESAGADLKAQLSLWAMQALPLVLDAADTAVLQSAARLQPEAAAAVSLLRHPGVLSVQRDALRVQGRRLPLAGPNPPGTEVWARPLSDGSYAVALWNRVPATAGGAAGAVITVELEALQLGRPWQLRFPSVGLHDEAIQALEAPAQESSGSSGSGFIPHKSMAVSDSFEEQAASLLFDAAARDERSFDHAVTAALAAAAEERTFTLEEESHAADAAAPASRLAKLKRGWRKAVDVLLQRKHRGSTTADSATAPLVNSALVSDVWTGAQLGLYNNSYAAHVAPGGVQLVRLVPLLADGSRWCDEPPPPTDPHDQQDDEEGNVAVQSQPQPTGEPVDVVEISSEGAVELPPELQQQAQPGPAAQEAEAAEMPDTQQQQQEQQERQEPVAVKEVLIDPAAQLLQAEDSAVQEVAAEQARAVPTAAASEAMAVHLPPQPIELPTILPVQEMDVMEDVSSETEAVSAQPHLAAGAGAGTASSAADVVVGVPLEAEEPEGAPLLLMRSGGQQPEVVTPDSTPLQPVPAIQSEAVEEVPTPPSAVQVPLPEMPVQEDTSEGTPPERPEVSVPIPPPSEADVPAAVRRAWSKARDAVMWALRDSLTIPIIAALVIAPLAAALIIRANRMWVARRKIRAIRQQLVAAGHGGSDRDALLAAVAAGGGQAGLQAASAASSDRKASPRLVLHAGPVEVELPLSDPHGRTASVTSSVAGEALEASLAQSEVVQALLVPQKEPASPYLYDDSEEEDEKAKEQQRRSSGGGGGRTSSASAASKGGTSAHEDRGRTSSGSSDSSGGGDAGGGGRDSAASASAAARRRHNVPRL